MKNTKISKLDRIIISITKWIGTPMSLFVHTLFFVGIFFLKYFGFTIDDILLILTTAVSLEAIYLAIFIQMTVNRNTQDIEDVFEDIQQIGNDVEELSLDVDKIQENVKEISADVQYIENNVEELSLDVGKIQEEVKEISEDMDEISQDNDADKYDRFNTKSTLINMQETLQKLIKEIDNLKDKIK